MRTVSELKEDAKEYYGKIQGALNSIQHKLDWAGMADFRPEVGIVLGSGLGGFAKDPEIEVVAEMDYSEISHFPVPLNSDHAGKLIFGALDMLPIVMMQGRVHCYEYGNDPTGMRTVAFPTRVMKGLGIETLVLTSAVGGLDPNFNPGELMIVSSVNNKMGSNPLMGYNDERLGTRFPVMTEMLDYDLANMMMDAVGSVRQEFHNSGKKLNSDMYVGICAAMTGPNYETDADVISLRKKECRTVGMSLVPELWAAKHGNWKPLRKNKGLDRILRTIAVNAVTNVVGKDGKNKTSHEEVIEAGKKMEAYFPQIMKQFLRNYAKA